MFGKKKNSEPKETAQKKKKPIYKRIWFWILVLAIAGMAMGGGGSGDDTTAEQPEQAQTETVAEDTAPSEDVKADARDKDTAIYGAVLSAETKYNGLIDLMGSDNLLDIYDGCKDTHDFAQDCWGRINDQKDDLNEDYVEAAKLYCVQIKIICEHLEDYINDQDMEDLSKAKEGMEYLNACILDVVAQRQAYLTAAGFTAEEIEEINAVYGIE